MSEAIDWERVYAAFDGRMQNCLGAQCSKPCCNVKYTGTWNQGQQAYNTAMDPSEREFQLAHFGPFPQGIDIEMVDANTDRGAPFYRHLVRGCLGADGSCRLHDRKPVACRLYPLDPTSFTPLKSNCPQVGVITMEPDVQAGMIRVREALGVTTGHAEWQASVGRLAEVYVQIRPRPIGRALTD